MPAAPVMTGLARVRLVPPFIFFFQAEDGIRAATVTGVQTCALPISSCRGSQNGPRREGFASPRNTGAPLTAAGRSERTPPSKRERGRVKSNQTTAVLAPFSTAIDSQPATAQAQAQLGRVAQASYQC